MNYQSYPTVKDTPNRKSRKAARKKIFWENKFLKGRLKAEKRKEKENGL